MGIHDAISACVYVSASGSVCVQGEREGESISAAISQDNSLLESMFVIAVKVWCTLILVLP